MKSKVNNIRRQFNRNANRYDTHAHIQRKMQELLVNRLIGWQEQTEMNQPNILEIGCGTGALTYHLTQQFPAATITALDLAPDMIKVAQERIANEEIHNQSVSNISRDRIRFVQEDIEHWSLNEEAGSFDLIVSNACFQWLVTPQETLKQLRRLLRPGGMLLFTTFGPKTFCELHHSFDEVYKSFGLKPQRHGLSFHSIDEWNQMLVHADLINNRYEQFINIENYDSANHFLHSVKAMGASTSEANSSKLSVRRLMTSMLDEYDNTYKVQAGVVATFDLLLFQSSILLK
ncbi:malonyl-ACP O-methyltransferase BioC [Paenibacillus sp. GSMTC-2017]|uniref:malonyl-ACP O-methyltransferase BioC n=1 Tax=Paenibacillus sp. GSMTC-2017 TaxID=2794350 RepID=UPI0018D783A2|nr:malonyl-ACP O-methyltransferase BioC [Paenibacillus sp. GSMTC-2017]MBH5316419.1 malonyl-ACP O-methyltransferase BioC [Paenibacillus sp. GSMTC-2017]